MSAETKTSSKAALTGIIAALAASSCCIPPVIALIAGVGGASSSLSWMEPFRPYLIGLAVVSIGYAWYANLKPKKVDDCGCDIEKPKFYQTKGFLIGMTLFASVSIAFPYYSGIFYSDNSKQVVISDKSTIRSIEVSIEGMTCDACENHVNHAVNELSGIIGVTSSYANANTVVEFDETQTSIEDIEAAVNSTGYKAIGTKQTSNLK
ncbi:MAG: mercuric transport protein MerTP [Flavobacteriales bacterium]|nr:mercuric transport protein MerTP [Flavobacteriales bacterium]